MKKSPLKLQTTLLFLWMSHFLVDMMIGVWPVYKTMAELDLAIAGFISSLGALIGEGMQVIFGPLSDRGYRNRLIWGGLLVTCANAFLAYTANYQLIFLLFFLTCLGSGAFHPSAAGLAGSLTNDRKSLFLTIFASGGSLGLALSQIFFSNVYIWTNGHTLFLAIPTMIISLAIALYGLSGTHSHIPSKNSPISELKTLFRFFKHRELRLLYIAQVCNQALFWGIVFLLPDVLISRHYDHWICFGGCHFFLMLGGAFALIPSGYLADKYSPKNVILIACFLSLVLFYLFILKSELSYYYLILLMFSMGATFGVINPLLVSMGNRLVPESPGKISAFMMGLAWCVSEGVGQGGGGLLTKLFAEDAPTKALGLLGFLLIICFGTLLLFPKELTKTSSGQIEYT